MSSPTDGLSSDSYIYIAIAAFMFIICTRTEQLRHRREREEDEELRRQAEAARAAKVIDPEERKKEIENALIVKEVGADGVEAENEPQKLLPPKSDEPSEPEVEDLEASPVGYRSLLPLHVSSEPGNRSFLPKRFQRKRGTKSTRRSPFSSQSVSSNASASTGGMTTRSMPLYHRIESGDEEDDDIEMGLHVPLGDDVRIGCADQAMEAAYDSVSTSDTSDNSDSSDMEEGSVQISSSDDNDSDELSKSQGVAIEDLHPEEDAVARDTRGQLSEDSTCSICLLGYDEGDKVAWSRNPTCQHAFHEECLVPWLMQHGECPYCRSTYFGFDKADNQESDASGEAPIDEAATQSPERSPGTTSYITFLLGVSS